MERIVDEFDEALFRLTHMKARQLVGKFGLTWDDVEDVANELYLDWIQHSRRFQVGRSNRRTFQNRIINNAVVDLVRKRSAQLRGYGVIIVPLYHMNADCAATCDAENGDLDQRLDISKVVNGMPSDLIHIAMTLMRDDSISGTAQQLGMSRACLYRNIVKIRGFFEQAGLRPPSRKATKQRKQKGPSHNRRPVKADT